MERKTSLLIGLRTRRNILNGKVVRKLEDGGDNFEDYWTDSDGESSTLSKSSIHSSELPNIESPNSKNASCISKTRFSSLKSKAVTSPLKPKAVSSPLKSKAVSSPLRSKAVSSPLGSKAVSSPLGSKAVSSQLRSKAVSSQLRSKAVSSPLKSKAVSSPLKSKTVSSPLKSKAVSSPLKSKAVSSPLKSKAVSSPLKSKDVHSPLKSKRLLYNDSVNTDGVANANQKTPAIEFEDITVNLGVDDNNPESEALNEALANIARNKLPEVSSGEIQEIHNANNSPLSCISNVAELREIDNVNYSPLSRTYNKKSDLLVSKISFKSSKKSISRSTKKDAKITELQSQFDEYDEKIMQMIHTIVDKNERISNSSKEEMLLFEENSYLMGKKKKQSKVKQQTIKVSRNIQGKENFADDETSNEGIDMNSKSLSQSINDSESLPFENIQMKKTETTSKHKKNKFSEKNLIVDSNHTADISVNSHEDVSYFQSDTDTGEMQTDKRAVVSKKSLLDNHLNTNMNSPGNTSDVINSDTDSPSKNTRKHKKNNTEDLYYSECDVNTGETKANKGTAVSKNYLPDNYPNANINSPANTSDVTNSDANSPSKNARKQKNNIKNSSYSESCINTCETQAAVSEISLQDNHLNACVNSPGSTHDVINSNTDSPSKNTRKLSKSNAHKTSIFVDQHSSKNVMPQKSLPSSPVSKSFLKKSKLHKKDALCQSKVALDIDTNNDNIDDDISNSASKDTSSNIGNNNTSEVCMIEKEKTTTNNKVHFIPDKSNLDATSFNESSHFQTVKHRKTFVKKRSISISDTCYVANTSMNFSEDSVEASEINMEKPAKKLKKNENDKSRQSKTNRKSCFISHKDIVETADIDSSYKLQTSTRRTARKRSVSEVNDVANTSINFSEKSVSVSRVNMGKTTKKQVKDKEGKMRQKETNKNNCFILHEDIVETADLDSYSQSPTSEKRKTRNSSITKNDDFVDRPLNYSKNSVNCTDGINHKKIDKKQRKIEKYKSRQKSASNKSDFISDEVIVERDDLSISQLQTLENSSHHKSVNVKKAAKKQRESSKSNDMQKTSGSSQQQTKRQKRSVSARNNFISEENDQADESINSSGNISVNKSPVIRKKKTTAKQKNVEINKSRPLLDDIKDKSQSKVQASKKSKSNLTKNNINKENDESNHAPIRRSTRERFAPLARWRNERLCYGFRDGNIETFGVDKGTNEDTGFLKSLYKSKQKQKIKKPKSVIITDVVENKKKRVHLLKKFPLIPWDSPLRCKTDENPSHAFLIKRMLETKKNSFGYIHIDVGKTKPPQYMPEEDLLLTLIEGGVEIHLHDKVYTLDRKDMFIVPRGTAYNITNISKKRALISYVVGKFKFLDDF